MEPIKVRLDELEKKIIQIGFVGENEYRQVEFDCGDVFRDHPEAIPGLSVKNPKGVKYPATVTRDGDTVTWDVLDSDLAAGGNGEIQLVFTENGIIGRTYVGKTKIHRSIIANEEAPDPVEDWLERANEALEDIEQAVEDSETAVRNANEAVETANDAVNTANAASAIANAAALKIDGMTVAASELPAGSNPTAAVSDVSGHKHIAFGIPKGDKGDPGDPGEPGDPTLLIDDTAGTGETEKTWSANKLAAGIGGKINKPSTSPDGAKGQTLITNGDGTTMWAKTLVTPQMYGAKADGTTDDTLAIQAALDNNYDVFFPIGKYKITSPLVIRGGTTIEGASKYNSEILAVGCDCIHMTTGDAGERGHIHNIHLRGDYTADTKGIVLAHNASGWTIDTVWVGDFDYGIYGFQVGNINNIYITQCIITGKPNANTAMHVGIHLANSSGNGVNACVIRDCEINMFEKGITIGGTAHSILQCTIQSCDYGIVVDPAIGSGSSTMALTISGNYMELIDKNYILIKSIVAGLQITNNYLYKANSLNVNYAVIKLETTSFPSSGRMANGGTGAYRAFSSVLIGMNHIQKHSTCKAYDLKCSLGKDSLFINEPYIGGSPGGDLQVSGETLGTGATLLLGKPMYESLNIFAHRYTTDGTVTIANDGKSFEIAQGGCLKVYINRPELCAVDYKASAPSYPAYCRAGAQYRSAYDGKLYKSYDIFNSDNLLSDETSTATEGKRSLSAETDHSFYALSYYNAEKANFSWNDYTGYVLVFLAPDNDVTYKNIMLQYCR